MIKNLTSRPILLGAIIIAVAILLSAWLISGRTAPALTNDTASTQASSGDLGLACQRKWSELFGDDPSFQVRDTVDAGDFTRVNFGSGLGNKGSLTAAGGWIVRLVGAPLTACPGAY
ncbi:hypothetical protein GCM10022631_26430 [Deinococcus rubellus]|uniref:hypothetical protein n=1 Tax=Deinococcus rubellus TaxID=1889240 RepID=UPI0031E63448